MRVLVVTNLYPNPYQPGRSPFNRHQLRSLAARHEVAAIAPVAWTDELAARARGAGPLARGRRAGGDGVEVDHPRYLFPPRVLRSWYGHCFAYSIARPFARAVAEFRPDVVLGSWAYPDGWAAVELGHRAGLPVAVQVHGCDVLNAGRGLDRAPGRKRRTADALRRADAVVAVSRHLAEQAVGLGADPARVHVCPQGVETDHFTPGDRAAARGRLGIPPGDPVLLWVGRFDPVKGLDVLLAACAGLVARGVGFRLYFVGAGGLRGALEADARARGLSGCVHFVGPCPNEGLPDWYRAADLTVLPSRSEGLPNVLRESLACGTPFVASRVGGVPEIAAGGAGRLVTPGDPADLADALERALCGGPAEARDAEPGPRYPILSWDDSSRLLAAALTPLTGGTAAGRAGAGVAPGHADHHDPRS